MKYILLFILFIIFYISGFAQTATVTSTDVTCFGGNNGSIDIINPSGGAGPYEYSIDGKFSWFPLGSFPGLTSGIYDIWIRDALLIEVQLDAGHILTEPAVLSATVTPTNVTICNGNNNGSIVMGAPVGGSLSYEYTINGGTNWQSSPNFTNQIAGTYDVRIRDANVTACAITLNAALVLNQPVALSATLNSTNANCYNTSNGSISITVPLGGGGTYGYSNDGGTSWQGSGTFISLSAGMYNVKIRDAVNTTCSVTLNGALIIAEPNILAATIAPVNVTVCNGNNNGSITINGASGGGGGYQYSNNGGGAWQGSNSFALLTAGTYDVRIRDAVATTCIITLNATQAIIQPTALSGTLAKTDVSCFGSNDGTITVTAFGGGGTYEYSINGGVAWQGSDSFTLLIAGTYDIRIRDLANPSCVATINAAYTINQPAVLNATVTPTDVTICNGNNNGSIVMGAPVGGSLSYEYTINGGTNWQSSPNFTNQIAGIYDVRIRDANVTACAITLNAALVLNQPVALSATLNSINANCYNTSNGSITITVPLGGGGTYDYSSNGGTSWQASGTFNSLSAGMYNVKIRDAVNTTCSVTLNGALIIAEPNILAATIAPVNVTVCNGNNNGSITINGASGGGGGYQYSINGGVAWQIFNSFPNLIAGTYDVRIRDFAVPTCIIILNATQTILQPTTLSGTIAKTDVTCFGSNDGTITIGATGGSGAWEYSIDGGFSWQSTNSFSNLIAGSYDVYIRDIANPSCFLSLNPTYAINQPFILSGTITAVNGSICNGSNNGSITINGSAGGTGIFQYTINGGTNWQSSNSFAGLAAGSYNVQIRDANAQACVITLNTTQAISQPAILSATLGKTDVTCYNASTGIISITAPAGGSGSFDYSINGGTSWQASGTFNVLSAGTYNVLMRDAANITCTKTLNSFYTITQPNILAATIAPVNVTACYGNNNGSITINGATGGSGSYEYTINGGLLWQSGFNFPNLITGSYDVRIRDAATPTCSIILNATQIIAQPAVLSAIITSTDVNCNGSANGSIVIIGATGGSGTYDYSINGGVWQVSATFNGLASGSYNVKIRDAANPSCEITLNTAYEIYQPIILSGTITAVNGSICNGSNNGSITINGSAGGSGIYQYSINGGTNWQSGNSFAGLAAGSYNVQIRDANAQACIITLNTTQAISQPAILSATLGKTDVTCYNASTGIISITAPAGGSGSFEYSINGGINWFANSTFDSLNAGLYNVKMRDSANITCMITLNGSLTILQPNILTATIVPTNVTACYGNNNGSISITGASGGNGTYEYSINGGIPWQIGFNFPNLITGSYDVRIRDAATPTCSIILNATQIIAQPTVLSAIITSTDVNCNGSANGSIVIIGATGGSGTYEYSINGGVWQVSATFNGLASGSYNVKIRDAANPSCEITLNTAYAIYQPVILSGTIAAVNGSVCNGSNNGSITINGSAGGSGIYQYSINGGTNWQSSNSFAGLAAGSYNVQIRDANSQACVITLNATQAISQPAILSATLGKTDVTCYNASTGIISITAPAGGSGSFEYSINGGINWFANSTFDSLNAGLYNVKMRDSANITCMITLNGSLTILQPNILAATIVPTNVTACYGNNNGSISITGALGGNGTYEYSINGGLPWQSGFNFPNLITGSYDVRIRDAAVPVCSITLNSAVILSQPVLLSATISSTDISCNGANNGSITISSSSGGSGSFEYSINGGLNWQSLTLFNSLPIGSNNVQIRDAANPTCIIILNPALIISQPTALNSSITYTEISCTGYNNGTATISANGGVAPYSYLWSNNDILNLADSLFAGITSVTATDFNGCTITDSINIPDPLIFNVSISLTQALKCNNDSDAVLTVTETNGLSPYVYSWDDLLIQTTQSADSLPAGTYSVSVTDTKGCFASVSYTLIAPIDSTVNINALATYTFSSNDSTSISLSGTPLGGDFSGPGVLNFNNIFIPALCDTGTWFITYTYTQPFTNCVISDFDTIFVINVKGTINGISDTVYYCYGDTNILIWGIPAPNPNDTGWFDTTGVYATYIQNLGNKQGFFNPTVAGPGTHLIKFQYLFNSATLDVLMYVKVDSVSTPRIINIDTAYCLSNDLITVNAVNKFPPNGVGVWSGLSFFSVNTNDAKFYIDSAGVGSDTIFFTYTAPSQCSMQIDTVFVINPLPVDSFMALDKICRNGTPLELQGLQGSNPNIVTDFFKINTGTFNIDSIIINPANISLGSNFITYQFHDTITTCVNSWFDTLFVNRVATLDILGDADKYCTNEPIDTMTGTYTFNDNDFYNGGIFSGIGIDSLGIGYGVINPALIPGSLFSANLQYNDTIFLNYTDSNGCSVKKLVSVPIYGLPNVNIVGITQHSYCVDNPTSFLSTSVIPLIPGSSAYTILNVPTIILQPVDYADSLNQTLTQSYINVPIHLIYTTDPFTNGNCKINIYDTVVIHKLPDVDFAINSNKCIADTIQFAGISTIDSISVWNWDFDDGGTSQNDSMPSFKYNTGGNKTIELTLTSKYGCVNSKDSTIYFDSIPKAQFTWKNECFGGSVVFADNSIGDTIISYLWNFGDSFSSTLQNPSHQYADTGYYNITLTITTQNFCTNSITQTALIRPEITTYPYFETFDNSSGAWSSGSTNNKNSWRYGQALSSNLPPPFSGISAWYISYKADSAYKNNEKSYVISPCFNFDTLIRPMLKMKIFCSLEKDYDGVALQYLLDNDSTWLTLKVATEEEDGINWYGKTVNNSFPGGGNYGWSDTLNKQWVDVRHDLDIIAGKTNVRFRIAFASSNINIYTGFAFDDIWIGERTKKILYEHFTNANVNGDWDNVFNNWVSTDKRDVVDIQYHTSFPTADKLNSDNTADPSARSLLYGVSQVSYSLMDGDYYKGETSNWAIPTNYYRNSFIKRRLTDPKFNITLTKSISGASVNISASVKSTGTFNGNVTVQIAVLEKEINRTDVGNNGDTIFKSVLKKMLPDAGGTNYSINWNPNDSIIINQSCSLVDFYNLADNNIVVVAFIQDDVSKEIYQVATSDTSMSVYVDPIAIDDFQDFIAYPNPSNGNLNIIIKNPVEENSLLQIYNSIGELVNTKGILKGTVEQNIDMNTSSAGIYFIRLLSGNKVIGSKKITINR